MRIHPELLSTVKHLASELVYYMKKKQCFFSNFSLCVWIRLLLDSDSENVNTRPRAVYFVSGQVDFQVTYSNEQKQ